MCGNARPDSSRRRRSNARAQSGGGGEVEEEGLDRVLECGLTLAQVRELGERDITPEDFELLLTLDEQESIVKPGLLTAQQINAIERRCRVNILVAGDCSQRSVVTLRCFGGECRGRSGRRRSRGGSEEAAKGEGGEGGEGEEEVLEEVPECSVCLAEVIDVDRNDESKKSNNNHKKGSDGEMVEVGALRLPCGHFFHAPCLRQWLEKYNNNCPMCNTKIEMDDASNEE